MIRDKFILFNNKKSEENPETKHLVIWILIAVFIVIVWFLVNGMIRKILTLY